MERRKTKEEENGHKAKRTEKYKIKKQQTPRDIVCLALSGVSGSIHPPVTSNKHELSIITFIFVGRQ